MLGEVTRQGQYKVYQTDINLFEAIALAGGMTDFANRNKIASNSANKNRILCSLR